MRKLRIASLAVLRPGLVACNEKKDEGSSALQPASATTAPAKTTLSPTAASDADNAPAGND
ncbi:hypothetical protein ACFO1V_03525 [Daeguia caeni]|uniref:Uncharacterized protein n=1 Tax=Daeguia caeni TaxID=439612 RepID=A0ABV9H577_9HYPH